MLRYGMLHHVVEKVAIYVIFRGAAEAGTGSARGGGGVGAGVFFSIALCIISGHQTGP
jgi:hypothetical protein